MVAIAEKINSSAGTAIKQEHNHQTARIIQWLGGERAGRLNKRKRIYSIDIHFSRCTSRIRCHIVSKGRRC
jgi:hypothetical protein